LRSSLHEQYNRVASNDFFDLSLCIHKFFLNEQ
jgi:hypothetical protein